MSVKIVKEMRSCDACPLVLLKCRLELALGLGIFDLRPTLTLMWQVEFKDCTESSTFLHKEIYHLGGFEMGG